jgi:hypothetical protein
VRLAEWERSPKTMRVELQVIGAGAWTGERQLHDQRSQITCCKRIAYLQLEKLVWDAIQFLHRYARHCEAQVCNWRKKISGFKSLWRT